ncbi:MAG: hypothetical protein IAE80_21135 [Anaerolinea sp.]|nr:hypothetical protein [Anaerolinea sp.]
MSESLTYHTVAELRALPTADLRQLWELVPTDRQRVYRTAYEREVRQAGAEGSDAKERQVALALLKRYHEAALVPVGARWARTPGRVQTAARIGTALDAPEAAAPVSQPSLKRLVPLLAAALIMIALFALRGGDRTEPALTPTFSRSLTPTPLALEAQDEVIEGGEGGRAALYPINVQVTLPDSPVPRVWVVQRRAVRASEWRYDPNPDTASYLSGMTVRPVIGIPWSEENAAWFAALDAGGEFRVQMNTGAILTYAFEAKTEVRRSDTGIFRQITPGLALLLLGETDADGLPTATRTLITAAYEPEQELTRAGELTSGLSLPTPVPLPTLSQTPSPTPHPFAGLDVQLIHVRYGNGQIITEFRLYNGANEPLTITPDHIWIAFSYVETSAGPHQPAEGLPSLVLMPDQVANLTLIWLWQGEPYGDLGVGTWRYALHFGT